MPPLKKLRLRIKQDRYAIFLGAGASIESGGYSASEIVISILTRIYGNKSSSELGEMFKAEYKCSDGFDEVLDALGTGKEDKKSLLREFFENMIPSEGYSILATFLKAGLIYPIVFTTNFDHMLEDALKEEKLIEENFTITSLIAEDIKSSDMIAKPNEIIIVHLHGDMYRREPIKTSNRQTLSLPKKSKKLIQQVCENQGIIIIGYRARDIGVRNALQEAKAYRNGIFWITNVPLDNVNDRDIFSLLDKQNSRDNVIIGTFNNIFQELGSKFKITLIRRRHEAKLNSAWYQLDRATSFGSERKPILEDLDNLSNGELLKIELDEAKAFREFVHYEIDRSGECYRLQHGVHLFEKALFDYSFFMKKVELTQIQYFLLRELLNLFLSNDQIPGGRLAYLDQLILQGERIVNEIDKHDGPIFLKARCMIALAEGYKEKSMITSDPKICSEAFMNAREKCEKAISLIEKLNDSEALYLRGTAFRHIAVTFEMEGNSSEDDEHQKFLYEKWQNYSSMAIEILEHIGEDTVRGYALLNYASSLTKLCRFEGSAFKKRKMLAEGKDKLLSSIAHLKEVKDHRGLGWAYYHLCENTLLRMDPDIERENPHDLLFELEKYANKAIGELRHIEDHLAQGLAYKQLGIALYKKSFNDIETKKLNLESAELALKRAINLLQRMGFHQDTREAANWLSECQFELWKHTSKQEYLLEALQSLVLGIVSGEKGLKNGDGLEGIYLSLKKEIKKLT